MLDFIVLGEVPGTSVRINFWWLLLLVAIVLVLIESFILSRRHNNLKCHYKEIKDLDLI